MKSQEAQSTHIVQNTKQSTLVFLGLKRYLLSTNARWYWAIIVFCMLTATSVLVLPKIHPLIYVRVLLGSVLIFWMPGYCMIKSLFPGKKLEKLELIALSLGTSTVLVPMMAYILHFTPSGIKTTPVTLVLLLFSLTLSTLAIFREHQDQSKRARKH